MPGYYQRWSEWSIVRFDLSVVPKLCPKYVRNIETYLTISKSIEILNPLKMCLLQENSIILYVLAFSAASIEKILNPRVIRLGVKYNH